MSGQCCHTLKLNKICGIKQDQKEHAPCIRSQAKVPNPRTPHLEHDLPDWNINLDKYLSTSNTISLEAHPSNLTSLDNSHHRNIQNKRFLSYPQSSRNYFTLLRRIIHFFRKILNVLLTPGHQPSLTEGCGHKKEAQQQQ